MTTSERPTSDAWKLVPVEPDDAMIETGQDALEEKNSWGGRAYASDVWKAMLASAVWKAMLASAPASPAIGAREAFKAGWWTNAAYDHPAEYLSGCEEADWSEYQKKGLDTYVTDLLSAAREEADTALHPAPEAASAGEAGIDEATMGRRWRVFEAIQHGWWGIEIDGDEEPLLYPIKTARETLSRLVDIHNTALSTPSDTAPSPKGVSDGVREALPDDAFASLLNMLMEADPWPYSVNRAPVEDLLDDESRRRGYCDWIEALHKFLPAREPAQEHAPGRKESQS